MIQHFARAENYHKRGMEPNVTLGPDWKLEVPKKQTRTN